ncbi:FUSC family protein [Planosporangium mesophilum]|uniref:FUSC family protein n=1 Tax=Planosporangium mesophilum TaxID=689768 RepID=A0A8J3X3F1_9ACTN|nr:FUSC family protein [Planosporangium mesophilum]
MATVVAFVVAHVLLGEPRPLLAALTALLVVQFTLYQTVRHSWQRIGSVVAGVLLAGLLSSVFGLTWWSLGVTVLAALIVGQGLRLGDHALEVPISAMLVLAVGSHTSAGLGRVYETLIGAAVGVCISLLAPPVYVQPAADAIGDLAEQIGRLLKTVAADVEQGWSHERALDSLRRARGLEDTVDGARRALAEAEDSLRLNPRRRVAHVPRTLRSRLTALEYSTIHVRVSCRCMTDRVEGVPAAELPGAEVRQPLADLLDASGDAVKAFGELVGSDVAGPAGDDSRLRRAVRRARELRDAASSAMLVDAQREPEIWRVHGAVVGHLDRLLDEIDPDAEVVAHGLNRHTPATSAVTLFPRLSSASLRRRRPGTARAVPRRAVSGRAPAAR